MTKETFLKIQGELWDNSPSYPGELTKERWLEICGEYYDKNTKLFDNSPQR